jgi:hypothetical protein
VAFVLVVCFKNAYAHFIGKSLGTAKFGNIHQGTPEPFKDRPILQFIPLRGGFMSLNRNGDL